ncbi:hypothetical protein HK100_004622 [Physocladia obscura]|uniref:Uncharacterized protein n=1 Tax=Physocladia obscura TaxID=109957 RepID=A0AAD5T8P9_9FUNG|nr:hypothetical protein HK100_004622 [Physocladia obscura]
MISANFRSTIASIKNPDSKDLQVYLKEEKDVVVAHTKLLQQRKGASDYYINWAAMKEEDIRFIFKLSFQAISARLQRIQEAFMQAENDYIHTLEQSRVRMKSIRDREKEISDTRAKLKSAISKRDTAQKKQQPAEALIQEARDIHSHILELEAKHLGLTRLDLREALRLKHEASVKYAVKLSVASKYSLYLADQIPQGELLPGQSLPPYTGQPTLEAIIADFTAAFNSDELVTVIRSEVPAQTLIPVPIPENPNPSTTFEEPGSPVASVAESASIYAAPKPQAYQAVSSYTYATSSTPATEGNGGYYTSETAANTVQNLSSQLGDVDVSANARNYSSQGYQQSMSAGTGYVSGALAQPSAAAPTGGYYSQYLPQQAVTQGYSTQQYSYPGPPPTQQQQNGYYAQPAQYSQISYPGPPPPLAQPLPPGYSSNNLPKVSRFENENVDEA